MDKNEVLKLRDDKKLTEVDHKRFNDSGYKFYFNLKDEDTKGLYDPYEGDIILIKDDESEVFIYEGGISDLSGLSRDKFKNL